MYNKTIYSHEAFMALLALALLTMQTRMNAAINITRSRTSPIPTIIGMMSGGGLVSGGMIGL